MFMVLAACLSAGIGGAGAGDWWNADWSARAKVTVDSGFYRRENMVVSYDVDFAAWLKKVGLDGAFDGQSPRVTRIRDGRQEDVPSRFIPQTERAAKGTLLWQRPGKIAPMVQETYFIYFDALGGAPKAAPKYPPLEPVRNLLANPDFDTPDPKDPTRVAGWEYRVPQQPEKGSIEWVKGFGHSSKPGAPERPSQCVKLVKNGADVSLVQRVKVQPGHLYIVSGWLKGIGSSGNAEAIFSAWYATANGGQVPAPKGGLYGNYKILAECSLMETEMPWVFVSRAGAGLYDPALKQDFLLPGGRLVPGTALATVGITTYGGNCSFYAGEIEFMEAGMGEPPDVRLEAVEKK